MNLAKVIISLATISILSLIGYIFIETQSIAQANTTYAFGMGYIAFMFTLMSLVSLRRIHELGDRDYNQRKIDIIHSSYKLLENMTAAGARDIDLDELIEANYMNEKKSNSEHFIR